MTNEEAIAAVDEMVEAAVAAVRAGVWASAFITFGGEATWDAVKGVSWAAEQLAEKAAPVVQLREVYEEILP